MNSDMEIASIGLGIATKGLVVGIGLSMMLDGSIFLGGLMIGLSIGFYLWSWRKKK